MLIHLHVKNLALIDEIEVDFQKGLNILTGETGAGKSVLIGSVNLALGQKASREMIRDGAESAFVELVFEVDKNTQQRLQHMDIFPEDGQVIISRRVLENRSICKLNGETCTVSKIREAASCLLDVHGQHEHQSLLYPEKQMEILDAYGKDEIALLLEQVKRFFLEFCAFKKELEGYQLDEEQRQREMNFLEFEIQEIEEAGLKDGEDEYLEAEYRRLSNSMKITESLGEIYKMTGYEQDGSAGQVGTALRRLSQVTQYDENLDNMYGILSDIDSLLGDFTRELSSYMSDFTFSEEKFKGIEERLDLINHLKAKYGKSIVDILNFQAEKQEELEKLQHFEQRKKELEQRLNQKEKELLVACELLTKARKKFAEKLKEMIVHALKDLNFLEVAFTIAFSERDQPTSNGKDKICFMISTNPGEPVRDLTKVVSGGELSRIMLAIKTILADKDETETLIFDEIDTGISGRTAWKVSEKMAVVGSGHQVLCITHLPQIAAQADAHYLIEKQVEENGTCTRIQRLDEKSSLEELARMLGGEKITETVLSNAKEMKDLAQKQKNTRLK